MALNEIWRLVYMMADGCVVCGKGTDSVRAA